MKTLNMGTHEAYAYVKSRSPWIGPNMSLIYQLTDYGRLCGYEKKPSSIQAPAPSSAPLSGTEARLYKDAVGEERPLVSPSITRLNRAFMARTQSQDRPEFLEVEVDRVVETMSSPRFVVSVEEKRKPTSLL